MHNWGDNAGMMQSEALFLKNSTDWSQLIHSYYGYHYIYHVVIDVISR